MEVKMVKRDRMVIMFLMSDLKFSPNLCGECPVWLKEKDLGLRMEERPHPLDRTECYECSYKKKYKGGKNE